MEADVTADEAAGRMLATKQAAEDAKKNAADAFAKVSVYARNDAETEKAAIAASTERARGYGCGAAAELLSPRAHPAALNTDCSVLKSSKEARRLFARSIYEAQLIPVLKLQRFARLLLRMWCFRTCAAQLISDVNRMGTANDASAEQISERRDHVTVCWI